MGRESGRRWLPAAAVAALALVLYLPTLFQDFIHYDDQLYVVENPQVRGGVSGEALRWSLTATKGGSWHPLTWWSHLAAVELFGLRPGGHHLVNAVLHASAAATLFLTLEALTGAMWPALLVGALFAVHPQHVESVAWISERKDVLAGLLWMLAIAAWVAHLRRPSPARYLRALGTFALGLAAKPSVTTLPLVLIALDAWPLGRLRAGAGRRLLRLAAEKAPFLLLSLAVGVVTVRAQAAANAMEGYAGAPPSFLATLAWVRAANAVTSLGDYLAKTVWPSGLAIFYPHPSHDIPAARVALSLGACAALTAASALLRRRAPWVGAGWSWFLVAVAPVIGLVQVGAQARADRYTYLPLIGIYLLVAWTAFHAARGRPPVRRALAICAVVAVAAFFAAAHRQVGFWRDTTTLFSRAAAVVGENDIVRRVLGVESRRLGRPAEAERHFRAALALNPTAAGLHNLLGMSLAEQGRLEEAVAEYREAIRIAPDYVEARNNLGVDLSGAGRLSEGEAELREALRRRPGEPAAWFNLGENLLRQRRPSEAADCYRRALELQPDLAQARERLALIAPRR